MFPMSLYRYCWRIVSIFLLRAAGVQFTRHVHVSSDWGVLFHWLYVLFALFVFLDAMVEIIHCIALSLALFLSLLTLLGDFGLRSPSARECARHYLFVYC